MKKIFLTILPLLIAVMTAVSVSAAYVNDHAGLLTAEEEGVLESLAEKQSITKGVDIVILTEDGIGGADPYLYCADFYDEAGFGDNGVLLFLEMEERDWVVITTGIMDLAVGDYGTDYIGETAVPHFSEGDYAAGFRIYINAAVSLYDGFADGDTVYSGGDGSYDYDYNYGCNDYVPSDDTYVGLGGRPVPNEGMGAAFYVIAFGISLLVAFLVCSGFKRQLNTAVRKRDASSYFDGMDVSMIASTDRFLYSRTSKIRRQTDDDHGRGSRSGGFSRSGGSTRSFRSSSGRSFRGGGGKF